MLIDIVGEYINHSVILNYYDNIYHMCFAVSYVPFKEYIIGETMSILPSSSHFVVGILSAVYLLPVSD
jgi:hypothetical protein